MTKLFIALAAALPLYFSTAPAAFAQADAYPSKAVRLLVGAPPGGGNDIVARAVGQKLGDALGQSIVIENRPGAGSMLAADLVAKSPPDGYAIYLANSSIAFAPSIYKALPFDPVRNLASIGQIGRVPLVVLVNKAMPINTLAELVDLARAKPRSVNFGSGGNGSPQHLAGELLNAIAGVQMVHVPYKGTGPAMTDLIGGQIQVMIEPLAAALPQVRGGRVKALAITAPQRVPTLPEIPTTREAGFAGLDVTNWYGLVVPAGTPADTVTKLNTALKKALADPATVAGLQSQGISPATGTPAEFSELISSEIARWKPIIEKAGVQPE
ncbi:MAG: tripartite tricarboxylate transporter substrate binding protein [Pseudomonadota bacterium]